MARSHRRNLSWREHPWRGLRDLELLSVAESWFALPALQANPAARLLLLAALAAALTAPAAAASKLWGTSGELWKPSGRLMDFSFVGGSSTRLLILDGELGWAQVRLWQDRAPPH